VDNDPLEANSIICNQFKVRLPIALKYVEEPRSGVTHARNTAVEQALALGADFVAFIDDDDIPQSDWLLQLLWRQIETGAHLVFGTWKADPSLPAWTINSGIFRDPSSVKNTSNDSRYGLPPYASTCNVMVGREILERVAATGCVFDHSFRFSGGEDKDFFIRARKLGAQFSTAHKSIIYMGRQPERYTARGLLRRGFKCGCSQVGMARSHGNLKRRVVLRIKTLLKLPLVAITLPLTVFSKKMILAHLYRIGKCSGVLYATFTGRALNYYARGDEPNN